MGDAVTIDKAVFHERLSTFLTQWKADKRNGDAVFQGVGSIVIPKGKPLNGEYDKTAAFQLWLLGYEFPATLFVITQERIYIVATKKKAGHLEPLKGGKTPVEILVRGKDAEENTKQFTQLRDAIKSAGKKVGVLNNQAKETTDSPFVEEWKKSFAEIASDVEEVDMAVTLSTAALSVKDERELESTRDASRASAAVMMKYFIPEMSRILDEEVKITNKALADKVTAKIDDAKFFQQNVKASKQFSPADLDWSTYPTVQSGGKYDLKFGNAPDDNNLHAGVIIAALGLRLQTYGSMVARTFLVDPNKSQERNYKFLEDLHKTVLSSIKDGATAKDVYKKALDQIKKEKPELEKHFLKTIGYGVGIESKDPTLAINAKSNRVLKDGMTLVITTGFTDIQNDKPQDKKSNVYSLVLTDTVRVTGGAEAANFTRAAASNSDAVLFFFKDEEPAEPKAKPKRDSRIGAVAQTNIKSSRLRAERATNQDAEKEAARREHQKELWEKKQQQGLDKYKKGVGALGNTEEKKFRRFESYKRDNQFPASVKNMICLVDEKNLTVIVPIMGRPVPFHINTIKNASTASEADWTTLRINFLSPGQGVGRKDDQPFEDPTAHFVRSLTFRSDDQDRMEKIAQQITDLKKEALKREQEKKQLEDVVEQDKLILAKDRRPPKLDLLFLRPALDGKRVPGHIEIHQNGIRYIHGIESRGGETKVDVLFSNIKHLFFQPCAHELIVIIHIHLINPIMIRGKKTKDVQFYREATEMQFDETGNRKRRHKYGDEEEFEAEQEERRRRAQLDKEFKTFALKIEEATRSDNIRVDMPFRELGFNGVPSRSSVWVQPTTDCLVQLTEPPFLVITLSDIEWVHLERVQFGLKNFDMVIIFKDYTRPVTHINTIPVESLDGVKDWLDSVEIPFSEGPLNLSWAPIMKTLQQDPHQFYLDGGWAFLSTESDDEQSEEEEESAFEVSESELEAASESSEDDSDFDENASDEASEEASDEDSEGEDWDELEKKAAKKDKERGDDSDDGGKSKKPALKRKR